jgi:hypothetical protein
MSTPSTPKRIFTAASCRWQARLFNLLAIGSTLLSFVLFALGSQFAPANMPFLPFAMAFPPIMLWLAASIFVYASIAHHPSETVRHFNKWAGYRYYAIAGFLTIFANDIAQNLPGGWLTVLGLGVIALVPWASWDVFQAGRANWVDIEVEVEHG